MQNTQYKSSPFKRIGLPSPRWKRYSLLRKEFKRHTRRAGGVCVYILLDIIQLSKKSKRGGKKSQKHGHQPFDPKKNKGQNQIVEKT